MKMAINGFGRIGRAAFKIIMDKHPEMEIMAVNDLADAKTMAHLLKHDSTYGAYGKEVSARGGDMAVGGKRIAVFSEKDPADLPWKRLGIDVVLEATGAFAKREQIAAHLAAGAGKAVVATSLARDQKVPIVVFGANGEIDLAGQDIVTCGSCTTNCVSPIFRILHEKFGIEKGMFATIHSYTSEQRLLDAPHKDLRRARAAAVSVIPTTTHASDAVGEVLPELGGKISASAYRVPVADVSVSEITAVLKKEAAAEEVAAVLEEAAEGELKGILAVSEEPLVSADYIGSPYSATVDLELTRINGNLARIVAWYDNEWGHASRFVELAEKIGRK